LLKASIDIVISDEAILCPEYVKELGTFGSETLHIVASHPPHSPMLLEFPEGSLFGFINKPWNCAAARELLVRATQQVALRFAAQVFSNAGEQPKAQSSSVPPSYSSVSSKSGLSHREREVLSLLQSDYRTGQVARKLNISVFTVRNHVKSIYEKLGVSSRDELRAHVSASA
jgi:DNA-binding CsgD family transcriptional regulator